MCYRQGRESSVLGTFSEGIFNIDKATIRRAYATEARVTVRTKETGWLYEWGSATMVAGGTGVKHLGFQGVCDLYTRRNMLSTHFPSHGVRNRGGLVLLLELLGKAAVCQGLSWYSWDRAKLMSAILITAGWARLVKASLG